MAYFRIFILSVVDSLRFKNRNTDEWFFVPKASFGIAHFFVLVIADNQSAVNGRLLKSGMEILYFLWMAVAVVVAKLRVDPTERYKWNVYVTAGTVTILPGVHVLFDASGGFGTSAIGFIVDYGVTNVFALLMAYLHWPYEVLSRPGGAAQGGMGQNVEAELSRGQLIQVVENE
jgi:hypothetical protein